MFTRSSKNVCRGLASLSALALLALNVQGQQPPLFPGFPNPAAPGAGSAGSVYTPFNPLASAVNPNYGGAGMPFVPPAWYPPYYYQMDPVGSYLYGTSAVVGSVGQYHMNRESAQVLHQMALQKQIETTKMLFDLKKYLKDNTPSFTDEQMKIAETTLKRILQNATPAEVWNGKALNVLLKDLTKQELDKASVKSLVLPEATLRQLNVTSGNNGNLGLLKDKGRFNWPIALADDELISKEERDAMSIQAEQLVTKAMNGSLDVKAFKDLKANIDKLNEKLPKKVLKIPTPQYMQAKRFLESFDEALFALQDTKMAEAYVDYQNFIKGGKSVQELVDYMAKQRGLTFAPASPGDEGAYEVLYSALANYDLMFNTALVSGKKNSN